MAGRAMSEINYRNGDLEIRVDDIQAIHVYDTLIESHSIIE